MALQIYGETDFLVEAGLEVAEIRLGDLGEATSSDELCTVGAPLLELVPTRWNLAGMTRCAGLQHELPIGSHSTVDP